MNDKDNELIWEAQVGKMGGVEFNRPDEQPVTVPVPADTPPGEASKSPTIQDDIKVLLNRNYAKLVPPLVDALAADHNLLARVVQHVSDEVLSKQLNAFLVNHNINPKPVTAPVASKSGELPVRTMHHTGLHNQ